MFNFLKSLFYSAPIVMSDKEKEDTIKVLRESSDRSKLLVSKYEKAIEEELKEDVIMTPDIDNFSKKIDKHDLHIIHLEKEIIRIKNSK